MNEITIYKIYCKDQNIKDIYIGSTSNFERRTFQHKYCCNNTNSKYYNNYKYVFIRENKGWDNWIMKSIITCSKEEQYKMERWHIENVEHTNLNKSIPTRTEKEYYEINKEKVKEYKKQYYENNREQIKEKQREKITCECGVTFRKDNKIRHNKSNKHQNYLKLNE